MKRLLKTAVGYLIQFCEWIENKNKKVFCDKFLGGQILDLNVKTDTGFAYASELGKTKPFNVYEVLFEDGTRFECADNHIFFTNRMESVACSELKPGVVLYGDGCVKVVKSVVKHGYKFCMYDISVEHPNHRYYTSGVLSHNTISSSIYLAWYILFNYDKTCFLCGNIEKTAVDILGKVQDVIRNVPFFMKPGIKKWGSLECKFENGCRLMGAATTERSGIGFTIHCLYLDEFAHVERGIIDQFFDNIYPTVSSLPDSKIIVTSTPNGMNRFYQIYDAATKKINSFVPFRIDWWQVPDWDKDKQCWVKRGEDWMNKKIADLGNGDVDLGTERFGMQYGNSFLSTGGLLLGPEALKRVENDKEEFVEKYHPVFDDYEIEEVSHLRWKKDVDLELVGNDDVIRLISVDISEGNGGDDLVLNIFNMIVMNEEDRKKILLPSSVRDYVGLEQIGVFNFNRMTLQQFAKLLYLISHRVFNPENVRILIEWNAFGGEVFQYLKTVFGDRNMFDSSTVLKFKRGLDTNKYDFGLKLNRDNKKILCQDCKRNIGVGRLVIHDVENVEQFKLFGRHGESYAAITGHDDIAMTCVDANAFFENRDFEWLADMVIDQYGMADVLASEMKQYESEIEDYTGIYSIGAQEYREPVKKITEMRNPLNNWSFR